jgi:alkylhydroperoxidase family enzyme
LDNKLVDIVKDDYRKAELDVPLRALLDVCARLTIKPWTIAQSDLSTLHGHGWSDGAIHDAFQVVSYFSYINRVCDGLGIDHETFMPNKPASWYRDPRGDEIR